MRGIERASGTGNCHKSQHSVKYCTVFMCVIIEDSTRFQGTIWTHKFLSSGTLQNPVNSYNNAMHINKITILFIKQNFLSPLAWATTLHTFGSSASSIPSLSSTFFVLPLPRPRIDDKLLARRLFTRFSRVQQESTQSSTQRSRISCVIFSSARLTVTRDIT